MEYCLVFGSNQRPAHHLRRAWLRIAAEHEVLACAPAMRTRDVGGARYLNAAVRIRSDLAFDALRLAMHAIEDDNGRQRGASPVTLDIDIVASRQAGHAWWVHKVDDLQRPYVQALLRQLGLDPDQMNKLRPPSTAST